MAEQNEEREADIGSCFSCDVDFHYPKLTEKLEDLLQVFKARSRAAKKIDDTYSSCD